MPNCECDEKVIEVEKIDNAKWRGWIVNLIRLSIARKVFASHNYQSFFK